MKTTIFFFMAALALTFAACSSDDTDLLIPDQPLTTDGIPFKATISTGTSGTRGLTPVGNDLVATWEVGEKVALIHNGVNDEMTVSAVSDAGVATIEGTITGNPNDGAAVTIIYPSTAADGATGDVLANLLCFQTSGTLDDVAAKYDVRKGNGTLKVDGTASLNGNVSLDNQNAIFKFTIKNAAGSAPINIKALGITIGDQTYVTAPASATSELYFVLPAVDNQKVSFAAVGDAKIYAFSKSSVTFAAGKYYQSTLKMSETDVLPGKFTINGSGDQINFSKGNLQATTTDNGANWTWAFAAHQWDYVGNNAANNAITGNKTVSTNGTVDLFGWSTAATYFGIHNSSDDNSVYSGDFKDWGETMGTGWSTLSQDKWDYLFKTRSASTVGTTADARFAKGRVNSVRGVILFPDTYTHPDGVTLPVGINVTNNTGWNNNNYSAADWTKMESAGCVFLPAAGYRDGGSVSGVGSRGYYWSSTAYGEDKAYGVYFRSDYLYADYNISRYNGYSVRLVRQAE